MTDIQMHETQLAELGRFGDAVPAGKAQPRGQMTRWFMSLPPAAKLRASQAPLSWPLVGIVIVSLATIAAALLYQDYRSVSAAGEQRAVSLAQIAATHVQQTLATIDAGLRVANTPFSSQLSSEPVLGSDPAYETDQGAADIQQLLMRISHAVPALTHLKAIRADGLLVADVDQTMAGSQDFSDNPIFAFHRDQTTKTLQLSRSTPSDEALLVSRRINGADGNFAGIILGQLNPADFSAFFAALGVDVVELRGSDGTILVRFPATDAGAAPVADRFIAVHALEKMPFSVRVGIDRREFLAPWESKRNIAVALVAALIALVVGGMAAMQKHTANAVALVALATRNRTEANARQQADELSRRKSDFLSQMSHELRTPLNAIIGFSEVIKEASFGPVGQPKYQEYADDIHYSAQHLLSVINNILDLSKVESGKWQISEDTVPLDELFDALLRLANERAARENVQLSIKSRSAGTIIKGDRRTLLQIMLNLTVNAIKFAGPNRLVDLDVRATQDGGIEITVADYGDGMTRDDLAKAMKPFDSPTSHLNRKKQDTGLGLPLAAAFAELHGGKVILDSAPGIGTTARLKLPASRVQQAAL